MKKLKLWDKKLAQALERVGRGKKLAFNLALCALIGGLIWMRSGWPLFSQEREFRRLEHTHLLPSSEIVFQTEAPGKAFVLPDGPELRFNPQVFVGLREKRVTLCVMEKYSDGQWDRSIVSLPRGEAPVLVPFLREGKYLEPVGWWPVETDKETVRTQDALIFLLLDAPEDTARVKLTVQGNGEEFSGDGWRMEDGNWLLGLESDLVGRRDIFYQNASYTLRLFDLDNTLLLERSGSFEEERA